MINISTDKFSWNITDKAPTFTGIYPNVTILTMLEAIRTSQEGIADELSGNTVAELMKRGTFGGFNEERIQLLLEVTWNNIGYDLKYKRIAAVESSPR